MEAQSLHNVNEASTLLIRSPGKPGDLTSILQHITQTAQDTFATDACVILAFNPITGRFIGSQTAIGSSKEEIEALHDRPRSDGVTQQVLKEGVILVEDLEAEPQYHNQFTRKKGIRAFAGLALLTRHRKRPLGVIYLDFKQLREFSAIDSESFQNFAIQASFLLQETWLAHNYEEVARIGQDVNQKLSTVADLFQELQTYVDAVLDDSHTFVLAIYQPQTDTLDLHIREQGNTFFVNRSPQGAYQYIIKKQQSWFVQQLSNEAKQLPFQIVNITGTVQKESLIFVPLTLRSVSLGVLSIQHPMPNAYGQEDLFILQLLATHIALALHNMRLYDNLTRLNETGQLLTQQLDSEQVLQTTVNKIRDVTKADVVVLYPYESALQRFVLPPRMAGTLLDPTFPQPSSPRPDDIAVLSLHHGESIFAEESENIYSFLFRGDNNRQGSFLQREKIRSTAAVPLKVGEKLVGVLFVNFRQPQYFNAPQKLLIEGLAHYAGIAIKNAEAFDTLIQRRMRELVILQDIDRELSYTLDLKSVLDTLLKRAYEHVSAEEASILLHNSGTQILETVAAIGRHSEISLMQNIPPQEGKSITRWVLKNKKPARVNDVHHDLKWRDLHLQVADDTISELDVPLLDGEDVVGVINFESIREGAFRQEDQDFLVTLAGQAVLAIKRAQAYEREKHLLEEAQALNEISKEITSQLDLSHVFDLILEKALELNNTKTGELMLYDSDQGDLWMAAERGVIKEKKGQRLTLDQGVVGYVARTKQWQIVDPSQSPWSELYLDFIPGTRSELAVPLLSGSDLRGVLNVESPTPHNFYERDVRLLTGLADLAVIALQNAQAYEREKHLLEEAQALNEISKEITSQLDLSHVFDLILEKALELTNSTLSTLMLHDPDQNDLWMVAERGVAKIKKNSRQNLDQGIVGYVARKKQLVNVKDVTEHPWNELYLEFTSETRSELAVPLLSGSDLRGVLNVESPTPHNFYERDVRLLTGLADLAVIALQNAQAYEREKHLLEEAQALNEISKEITSQLDLSHVFDLILEKALELTNSTLGSLHLFDRDQNNLKMVSEHGVAKDKKGQRQRLGEGIVGYAAKNKQLINVKDVSEHLWSNIYLEFIPETRSELAIPMLEGDDLRGVLNIESSNTDHFGESDERLLQGLARMAVVALQNAERYEKAEKEAQRFAMLYKAGDRLSKITEWTQLEQAYDITIQIAVEYSQCQVVIRSFDDETRELVLTRASQHQHHQPFQRMKLDEDLNRRVVRERRTIVINDSTNPPPGVSVRLSDPAIRSLAITPITFEDRYYGNLTFSNQDTNYFRSTDISFFDGLAQQLASTIYRLEVAKARQEFEQISSIGQSAFELTHRLGNDLGLVEFNVSEIQSELEKQGTTNIFVTEKLVDIVQSVQDVLIFSRDLKQELAKLGDKEETDVEPIIISPQVLLEEAKAVSPLSNDIHTALEIDEDVAPVRVIHSLVSDILNNLIANAVQAMPQGGNMTLRAHNAGRNVALEVIDTGEGIPPQQLSKIFDLFFSTKGSSGFGLWSARRNALRNYGDLKVESTLGEGTTFILLLPRTDGGTL